MDEEIDHQSIDSPISDLLIGIGIIGFAVYLLIEGSNYPAGKGGDPGSFAIPLLVASLMIIAGTALIILNLRKVKAAGGIDVWALAKANYKVLIFLGVLAAAALLLPIIGYTITVFFVLLTITRTLQASWLRSFLVATLGSVGSYYLFNQLFAVPLPSGFLGF